MPCSIAKPLYATQLMDYLMLPQRPLPRQVRHLCHKQRHLCRVQSLRCQLLCLSPLQQVRRMQPSTCYNKV